MTDKRNTTSPIAIIGMGLRLPGGVSTPDDFWNLLINKRDGRCTVPADRFNVHGFHGSKSHHQTVASEHGYFLQDVDLKAFDTSFFSSFRSKRHTLGVADPRQRLLLEVVWECIESAGQSNMQGSNTGVYIGAFGQDWHDLLSKDSQPPGISATLSADDVAISTQISRSFDLRGPAMVVQTGCSAALTSLHLACNALNNGDCSAAIVAGVSLIMNPSLTLDLSQQGVLSPTGSCKTFDAAADGYARGEAVNALLIKPLKDALRDNDPIRAIIRSTAINADGSTKSLGVPSPKCHESMIRRAYQAAGISDPSETPYVECHGTGTRVGDPLETSAVANFFGDKGTYIGSVKPNVGHSEGASGITSVIKAVLSLEKATIPPNINYSNPNPKIPFKKYNLRVPTEPVPWPKDRHFRISVNSFGAGGANAHVILESAASAGKLLPSKPTQNGISRPSVRNGNGVHKTGGNGAAKCNGFQAAKTNGNVNGVLAQPRCHLLPISASNEKSLHQRVSRLQDYLRSRPDCIGAAAYTLGSRRSHLSHRTFAISTYGSNLDVEPPRKAMGVKPEVVFVFTGQGAQWAGMGKLLVSQFSSFRSDMQQMDIALQGLTNPPTWSIEDILCCDKIENIIDSAEYAQPLCVAVQVGLVNYLSRCKIKANAVVGHSSGEIAAAYAAGVMTMTQAIICGYLRGQVTKRHTRCGGMAAISMGKDEILPYLIDGVQIACENSANNVTISGDPLALNEVLTRLEDQQTSVHRLRVNIAYHSDHMRGAADDYQTMVASHLTGDKSAIPFYSSVLGRRLEFADELTPDKPAYWRSNLSSPVLFHSAMRSLLKDMPQVTIFLEIGPHSSLEGSISQILQKDKSAPLATSVYIPTLTRESNPVGSILKAVGRMYALGCNVDFSGIGPQKATVLTDMPNYPWDHDSKYWAETRISRAWRFRKHPHHELLGSSSLEASETEPAWRNMLQVADAPWLADHKIASNIVFPIAGYIAMMGEAIRQVTGSQTYTLRNITVKSAMFLHESATVELMTTMRPLRLMEHNASSSSWYEFQISSFDGTSCVQNCLAQGKAGADGVAARAASSSSSTTASTSACPRHVSEHAFYDQLRRIGMNFGPRFRALKEIAASTSEMTATAAIHDSEEDHEAMYSVHPIAIDLCFQLCAISITQGVTRNINTLMVPTSIGSVIVSRPGGPDLIAKAIHQRSSNGSEHADVFAAPRGSRAPVINVKGLKTRTLVVDRPSSGLDQSYLAHLEWSPDPECSPVQNLIRQVPRDLADAHIKMEKLACLCILRLVDTFASIGAPVSKQHLIDYVDWLHKEKRNMIRGGYATLVPEAKKWAMCDGEDRSRLLKSLLREIAESKDVKASRFSMAVGRLVDPTNFKALMSGDLDAVEFFKQCGGRPEFRDIHNFIDATDFFSSCSHSNPILRILEIGGGKLSHAVLDAIRSRNGVLMCSEYVVTSSCAESLSNLQKPFKSADGVSFKQLDVSKDLLEQGFQLQDYDLIIAQNFIRSTTPALLPQSLQNIRSLLRPEGRLYLEELSQPYKWRFPSLLLGWLPDWTVEDEIDLTEQGLDTSTNEWKQQLCDAGFSCADVLIPGIGDDGCHRGVCFVSTVAPACAERTAKAVTLLYHKEPCGFARELALAWGRQGIKVSWKKFDDLDDQRNDHMAACGNDESDIISTMDLEGPFLDSISKENYDKFLAFLSKSAMRGFLWLTRPAQFHCVDPRYGLMTGFARNIRHELLMRFWTIEISSLDSSAVGLVDSIWLKFQRFPTITDRSIDSEYAIHDGMVYTGRFHWTPIAKELAPQMNENDPKRVMIDEWSAMDTLRWTQTKSSSLADDEVEISVRCAGLNFKDVLIAMGFIEGAKVLFGYEASGVVTRVGAAVTHVSVGDRILAMASGLFATTRIISASCVARIPDALSFEDAATMPIVYATAIHAIMNVGQLSEGQSILIHSACGGVGLAAIHICKMIGAEIYATVGNEEKAKYLVEQHGIPRERIFNSRNDLFQGAVMRATAGRGVDVVLNSLSGDLLHASWECVARRGKFLEIGKRDMLERGKLDMSIFQHNRAFYGIDIDALCREYPDEGRALLGQVVELYLQGSAKPIRPVQAFEAQEISAAFRYMQRGKHMGKIVIKVPERAQEIPATPAPQALEISRTASYLMIGGLGGLGKALVSWMVEAGARNVIFLSRSAGKSDEDQAFFRELESQGCRAIAVAGSVAEMKDVEAAVKAAPTPIAGVVQMSMVIRNGATLDLSHEDWVTVQDPKVRGTWNLHNALLGTELDFFILFSSLAGTLGLAYQANYASANTFLDSFLQYRHGLNLPCSVIDLGVMEGIGFLSGDSGRKLHQYRGIGAHMVQEQELMDAVQICVQRSQPQAEQGAGRRGYVNRGQIAVGLTSSKTVADATNLPLKVDARLLMYHHFEETSRGRPESSQEEDGLGDVLRTVERQPSKLLEEETLQRLREELAGRLCALVMAPQENLDMSVTLASMGIDSLTSIEVRNWWRRVLGTDISVLEIVKAGTVGGLGEAAIASLRNKYGIAMGERVTNGGVEQA